MLGLVHYNTAAVKAQDVVADTARSPGLHLMLVSEQFLTCVAPAVV